jgi:predicted PhzF superfamily epimerase YddE/YHI9
MADAATLHVLRVFCAEDGSGGNALGVFLDGTAVPEERRQAIAADLGFAETVFVDDRERAEIRIFTPGMELPLAGHPLVGTAWLLREEGTAVDVLRPPAGECAVRFEREVTFVAANPEWGPPWDLIELESPGAVDDLEGPPEGHDWAYVWSAVADSDVAIRARAFADDAGVAEDEATGSAALRLVAQLGRPIQIRQGPTAGSLIYARPLDGGVAEVGGAVQPHEVREYSLS